jgi:hypothetical protein
MVQLLYSAFIMCWDYVVSKVKRYINFMDWYRIGMFYFVY